MRCPFCGHLESKVIDSRVAGAGDVIRRRRECEACERRFTSRERVEDVLPMVVKRDGRREPFDRQKVILGLRKACDKRAVGPADLEALVDRIERELADGDTNEVTAKHVGELVMSELRKLDEVAYVRFASVYRSFRDIEEFRSEVEKIARGREDTG